MIQFFFKKIRDHKHLLLSILLSGILFFFFIPFIFLGVYNHFSADDFQQIIHLRDKGFWNTQIFYYTHWMGRYFAIALMSVYLMLGSIGPKLLPSLLILSLLGTLFLFLRTALPKTISFRQILFLCAILMILYVGYMRSVVEGLFWISGALQYQAGAILTLLCIISIIRERESGASIKKRIFYRCLALLTLICGIGSNEIVMALLIIITLGIAVWDIYKKRTLNKFSLVIIATAIVAAVAVFFAPGNANRLDAFPNNKDIYITMYKGGGHIILDISYWLLGVPLFFASIAVLPILDRIAKYWRGNQSILLRPAFAFISLVGMLSLSNAVAVWSMGFGPPFRAKNMIHFLFLILWFYTIIVCICSNKKVELVVKKTLSKQWICNGSMVILIAVTLVSSNVTLAWKDLLGGAAMRYDAQLKQRYAYIRERENESVVEVQPLNAFPASIFNAELSSNEKEWLNAIQAEYFKINALRLRRFPPPNIPSGDSYR